LPLWFTNDYQKYSNFKEMAGGDCCERLG